MVLSSQSLVPSEHRGETGEATSVASVHTKDGPLNATRYEQLDPQGELNVIGCPADSEREARAVAVKDGPLYEAIDIV
jgi:hypothetical protein